MLKDQVQVVAPDEYRRRIHWLIDRVLDAADEHNERLRWLILACREMGELEFLDRGIVHNVLRNPLSGGIDAALTEDERPYTDRQLQAEVRSAMRRGLPSKAILALVTMFTGRPERGLTTINFEERGDFIVVLRALKRIVSASSGEPLPVASRNAIERKLEDHVRRGADPLELADGIGPDVGPKITKCLTSC